MITAKIKLTPAYQAVLRLTDTRKMIASAKVGHIKDHEPDPARWTPQERIAVWTAETMARRPLR
jgi:hypothetical protein